MISIILANAPINNGNRGCVALSYTSIYLIDKILSEANIDYHLYLTDSRHVFQGDYEIEIEDKKILYTQICHPLPVDIKDFIKNFLKLKEIIRSIRVFKNADYILDIGEGDSFADIYGKIRFLCINLIHKEAKLFHKPYCLLPQTIGPFKSEFLKKKAIKAISGAKLVMARDLLSVKFVRDNIQSTNNVREYTDMAFFLPYSRSCFKDDMIHVGLNVSSLLWNGGYTRNDQFSLKYSYKDIIYSIIDYFLKQESVVLHLIPHVVRQERDVENDYAVLYDILKKYSNSRIILAPFFLSPVDAKSYISGMDFFMGARMHSTIAAFSTGVPVLPMAYSRKFNGLYVESLKYNYIIDLLTDSDSDVINKVKECYNCRNSLRTQILHTLDSVVESRKKELENDLKLFFDIA